MGFWRGDLMLSMWTDANLANEEREGPLDGTAKGDDVEACEIPAWVAVDAGGPYLQRFSDMTAGCESFTAPPMTGPKNRAKETVLCASPFARPTTLGGDMAFCGR